MKITVLKYGESFFEEKNILRNGRPDIKLPISFVFYLIETGNKKILVDVGCDDGAGFEMSIFSKPILVLSEYGLKDVDITDVVITHAHHDHIAAIQTYKNATIHIQNKEYQHGKKYIPTNFKIHKFDDEFHLTTNIVIRKIGGHSEGSSIVVCQSNNKNYILCGDECYIKACFEQQIPPGANYCPEASERFIQEYDPEKDIPLLFHDPDILKGRIGYEVILDESLKNTEKPESI